MLSFAEVCRGTENGSKDGCDYIFTLAGQILWQTNGGSCGALAAFGKPSFEKSVGFVLQRTQRGHA
jgi:hypothetical protein